MHPSDLVLEWYDLGRGVVHLGQDVAQLSQVLSFLAEVIVTLVAEVLLLADVTPCRSAIPCSLLDTPCYWPMSLPRQRAHTALLVEHPFAMLCLVCQPPFQGKPNQSPPRVLAKG